MNNCLKCSSYNDRKGICEITEKSVSPSDTCERADAERLPTTYNNTCSSCKHFNSSLIGGYCQYHRADTQGLNGCSDYEEQYKNVEFDSQHSNIASEPDEDGQQFVGIVLFSMFFLAVFIELSKKYPHIIISIVLVIVSLISILYGWIIGGKVSKIVSLMFLLVTLITMLYFFGGDIYDFIFQEKYSLPKIYHI